MWHVRGRLKTSSTRPKGLRDAAYTWLACENAYRQAGAAGIEYIAPDKEGGPLALSWDLYFKEESSASRAHTVLTRPKCDISPFRVFLVESVPESCAIDQVDIDATTLEKVKMYVHDDSSPPESMAGAVATTVPVPPPGVVQTHCFQFQNLCPKVGRSTCPQEAFLHHSVWMTAI